MSLRPRWPRLYSHGLRKPSRGLPFESKKSLSNEITPAMVCRWGRQLAARGRTDGRRAKGGRRGKTHGHRAARVINDIMLVAGDEVIVELSACAAMSGTPRPIRLYIL